MKTEQPKRYIKCLVVVYVISGLVYMGWRVGSINMSAPLFSIPLYAAELYGYVSGLLFVLMTYQLSVREAPPPEPGLSVDVYVPTYNESVELIRRTLLAAMRMDYPHVTWLLDDGHRESMRTLAEELGCRYLARDNNAHAKAGNLNNALQHSTGEFIAIFDADHAPRKDFLVKTLGYFKDAGVAFVQTPQDFFNIDSFNHRLGKKRVWDEQALFFKIIQRGKDALNAAFFCGSCAVIRRAAVARIGGFATETVTEDVHTAIRLHKLGYQSGVPRRVAGVRPGTAQHRYLPEAAHALGHGVHAGIPA
ncbi:glycosyltransferase [Cupriavidus sp. UYPR2.512]|uniref:glycosyltransferase family 2 protein n=1 Tax=Cupriavidus sp. UYPR2.512 TaxID=1080187 RepID=UPI00039AC3EF|nr:cellulose synthase catalytic subunit [Cupriavidus sp. UYPR2.512]